MSRKSSRVLRQFFLVCSCAFAIPAKAQQPAATVSGFVSDAAGGRPLAGAEIQLQGPRETRIAQSDASGGFRFRQVDPNTYRLSVRRIGFAEWSREIVVGPRDTTLSIDLTAIIALDTTRVGARFVGVYGIVGEAHSLRPLGGTTIALIGAGKSAVTDSSGSFAIETPKGGTFLARITRPGYGEQRLDVVVPPHERVELAPLLDSSNVRPAKGREYVWREFNERVTWGSMNSALVPGEEVSRQGGNLTDALRGSPTFVKRGLTIGPMICVYVNGEARPGWPLDAFDPSRIVAVELYGVRGDPTHTLATEWPPGAPCGMGNRLAQSAKGSDAHFAAIWLKP